MPRGLSNRAPQRCRGDGCAAYLPALRSAFAKYCAKCQPGQGEATNPRTTTEICPCRCGEVATVMVGARMYCEATARFLKDRFDTSTGAVRVVA